MKEKSAKSVWGIILKVIIAAATTLAGLLGLNTCMI